MGGRIHKHYVLWNFIAVWADQLLEWASKSNKCVKSVFFLKWKQTLWFVATNICLYDFYLFDYEAGNWDFTLFLGPSFDSE